MATTTSTDRPELRRVPLSDVPVAGRPTVPGEPTIVVTISVGQPLSVLHQVGYDLGAYLLELDNNEQLVRAYHRDGVQ